MKDEELRALEREVAASPTADGCLRLARELERVGRRAEVPAVLRRGREHAEVRRALGSLPVWDTAGGPYTKTYPHYAQPMLVAVDRRSGETRDLGLAGLGSMGEAVIAADQLHVLCPRPGAPELSTIDAMAITSGRLLVCTNRSTVIAIGDRTSA